MTINTDPLTAFMTRVRSMASTRSKEIRLTADEVTELSATIAQLLAHNLALETAIAEQSTEVHISGGTFS